MPDNKASVDNTKAEEPFKKPAPDYVRRDFVLKVCTVIIGFLSVLVAAIIGYFNLSHQINSVSNKVEKVDNRVENVQKNSLSNQLIVISPSEGERVDATAIVRGKTPYLERNHYIVVTPIKTNEDWVQQNVIKPDPTGAWVGRAEFGTGDVGIGEKFLVRVLATASTMPPGQLRNVPADAIPSESITVIRQK
jgi:hypothetical protein